VQDIFIACVDGLKGFPDAIEAVYPQAAVQLCIVHMVRNSLNFVPWKAQKGVAADLKLIYSAATADEAELRLTEFENKWDKQYKPISQSWRRNWERVIPFFDYPPEIRKVIYTTNAIESINMSLRKVTKTRSSFPTWVFRSIVPSDSGPSRPAIPVYRAQFDDLTGIGGHDTGISGHDAGELRHQDVRQQAGAGDAALDRTTWGRCLDDGVAAGARQLGAHMADHAEAGRHELQLLGHVLAERPQAATAGRASIGRRRIDPLVSWQMIGQWTAHRLLARRLVGGRHLARRLGLVGLQVFQLQLQLLELVVQLFRLAAELHAAQFGDLQLEVFDLDGARIQLFGQARQLSITLL
jgi:hypothetical protein